MQGWILYQNQCARTSARANN